MAGKTTDRKLKSKDAKSVAGNDQTDALANFSLPESLPCSEIEFPVLITKTATVNWQQILEEREQKFHEIAEYVESKHEKVSKAPFLKTECDYINNEVFSHLIPALEETLNKAKILEALLRQKCFFNGIDNIVQVEYITPEIKVNMSQVLQILWNNNPRHPERHGNNVHLFNMPWVRNYLIKNPRPYYPKSWLWPEDYAATLIQKTVRQYFVQREDEVQEMRDFWRKLEVERHAPEIDTNPFLAKRFATEPPSRKHQ